MDGKLRVANYGWQTTGGKLRVANNGWQTMDGKQWMANNEWVDPSKPIECPAKFVGMEEGCGVGHPRGNRQG